ncbi:MAG: TlpA family protein disulfide reductase [Bacteroidota bacterium]
MKHLITTLLIFSSFISYSQTQYYTTDGKNRLTESKVQNMLKEKADNMGKVIGKKFYGSLTVESTETKRDSIISKITFNISDKKQDQLINYGPLAEYKDKAFPNFTLKKLSGGNYNSEDLKGKPTMINFWFKECKPCIDEMPLLNQLAKKYEDEFNFISITYENKEDVVKFLNKHPFNFVHLVEGKKFLDSLGIKAYPMNLFLDKNGVLVYVKGGIPYKVEGGELRIGDGNEIIEIIEKLR